EGDELLGAYAWYSKNSQVRGLLPGVPGLLGVAGGRLKPNDFGLFDMLGNAVEWCQESADDHTPGPGGRATEAMEGKKYIKDDVLRVYRGGCLFDPPWYLRSANRSTCPPTSHFSYFGFRVARTFR